MANQPDAPTIGDATPIPSLTPLSSWEKYSTGIGAALPIVTPNAGQAPDGTNTATRVQLQRGALEAAPGGNNSYSLIRLTIAGPATAQVVTDSIYLRVASGTTPIGLRLASTGPYTASNPAGATVTDERVVANVTSQWQRFSVSALTYPGGQTFDLILWTSMPGTALAADILAWYPRADVGAIPQGMNYGRRGVSNVTLLALGVTLLALSGRR